MKNRTKIWIGVGTYLLTSTVPTLEILGSTDPSLLSIHQDSSVFAQSSDLCRKGLGGEGGARKDSESSTQDQGGEGGEGGESNTHDTHDQGGEGGEGGESNTHDTHDQGGEGEESNTHDTHDQGGEGGEGGEDGSSNKSPSVKRADLEKATADYKIYAMQEVNRLLVDAKAFTDRVIAGDVEGAKALYGSSRIGWERIEPIAESFAAFDSVIDLRVDDFQSEDDPEFTGFHRIEVGLFKYNTTQGYEPFAKKLMTDLQEFKACVSTLEIEPRDMVRGASELIEEVAQGKIAGEEDRYSHADFWSFKANLEGSEKIVALLRPMIATLDPALLQQIDRDFAAVYQLLAKYALPEGGFVTYDKLNSKDKQRLQADLARLAESLSKLPGILGV
jgi:iron uptake system component EfeO